MKIVINTNFGGFHLSDAAVDRYFELTGQPVEDPWGSMSRIDPVLVFVVEELGDRASHRPGDLSIVDIPAGEQYRIREYDGSEHIELASSIKWEVARG